MPVGAYPSKEWTFEPDVKLIAKSVRSWSDRFVNLGGRVVLINFMLHSIEIFYLSLIKIHVKEWKRKVWLERCFV